MTDLQKLNEEIRAAEDVIRSLENHQALLLSWLREGIKRDPTSAWSHGARAAIEKIAV